MPNTNDQRKSGVRQQIANALCSLTQADVGMRSRQAIALLRTRPLWRSASSVLFYAPTPRELDIWPLVPEALAQGRRVFLPRFRAEHGDYGISELRDFDRDLEVGPFGIRQPVTGCPSQQLKALDFILVPGVAFDSHGRRLGRGKGYYDRLLGSVRGITCGVGFDEQIVSEVPVEPHDVRLNCILTPTRWIEL